MEHVKTGEPLKIAASDWNAVLDLLRKPAHGASGGPSLSGVASGVVVRVRSAGTAFGAYRAVGIGTRYPSAPEKGGSFTADAPVFAAELPSGDTPWGIALEPIAERGSGRVLLFGVAPARVSVSDGRHHWAAPDEGGGILLSRESGGARILVRGSDALGDQWCLVLLGGSSEGVKSDVAPALVRNTGADGTLSVDVYGNGVFFPRTESGTLVVPELTRHMRVPYGTTLLAHLCEATYTGGGTEG